MGKASKGGVGCGCLVFIVVLVIILSGLLIHPFSLRLIGSRFYYADKIMPANAIYVPRFPEDKNGEVYVDAFHEFWSGNGKLIWIENDHIFGFSLKDIIARMASERRIKEDAVRSLDVEGDDLVKATQVKRAFSKLGYSKVVVVVPDYASRRFHRLYDLKEGSKGTVFLIKPVRVSYFKPEQWWKDGFSRKLVGHELSEMALYFVHGFKGSNKESAQGGVRNRREKKAG